jgi:hypothetical protein
LPPWQSERTQLVLAILRDRARVAGVSAYYLVDAGDKLFAITVADDESSAEESVSEAQEQRDAPLPA